MGCRLQIMKQVSRIHLIWGATALGAFLVGYFLLPSSSEKGQFSIPRTGERAGSKSGLEDEREGSRVKRGEMAGAGLGAGAKEGISSILSQKVVLSESEITNLGETFRGSSDPVAKRLAFSKLLQGLTAENALLIRGRSRGRITGVLNFRNFTTRGARWPEWTRSCSGSTRKRMT